MNKPLPITRYRLHYQAITPIRLPDYAGSALRGAFGHALKSIACFTASRNKGVCTCAEHTPCIYRQLFDPPTRATTRGQQQDVPTPLIIEPSSDEHVLLAGESAHFDLVLIGEFAHQQMAIIQLAWQRALHDGIGAMDEHGKRGQATFTSMLVENQPAPILPMNPKTVHLKLLSPLRLQHRGEWIVSPLLTAPILLHAIIRRYQLLHELYGQSQMSPYTATLQPQIEGVQLQRHLSWTEWTRWSNRQKQQMSLSGLTGRLLLENVPDELWPYIYYGQWLHAGKNSMFGLGHYQIVDQPWIYSEAQFKQEKIA